MKRALVIALLAVACGGGTPAGSVAYSAEQAQACQTAELITSGFPPPGWFLQGAPADEVRSGLLQSLSGVSTDLQKLPPTGAEAQVSAFGQTVSKALNELQQPMTQEQLDAVIADYTTAQNALITQCNSIIQSAIDRGLIQATDTIPTEGPIAGATPCAFDQIDFVPLPPTVYGTMDTPGSQIADIGKPLPTKEQPLFGADEIVTVVPAFDGRGQRGAQITLSTHATTLLADFTMDHIREYFAVVIDGRVGERFLIQGTYTGEPLTIAESDSPRLCP